MSIFERESALTCWVREEGEGQREETGSEAGSADSREPYVGLELTDHEIMT